MTAHRPEELEEEKEASNIVLKLSRMNLQSQEDIKVKIDKIEFINLSG